MTGLSGFLVDAFLGGMARPLCPHEPVRKCAFSDEEVLADFEEEASGRGLFSYAGTHSNPTLDIGRPKPNLSGVRFMEDCK